MSFALNPLKTIRVVDPRVNFSNDRMYSVLTGGSQVSWKSFTTTSFSNSSINFTAPPPNPGICVDPKVYITVPVELTFAARRISLLHIPPVVDPPAPGINIGDPIPWTDNDRVLKDGCDAFRAFPISSITNTLSVN